MNILLFAFLVPFLPFLLPLHPLSFTKRRMSSTIRAVSTILQMLKRWRHKARGGLLSTTPRTPSDVPAGHVAVYVGITRKRYVLRATRLNHPIFKRLLAEAEEEFGFPADGPLAIPCNESLFEEILALVSRSTGQQQYHHHHRQAVGICEPQRCSHVGMRGRLGESRQLLNGVAD